jgi:hypothetical protein
MGGCSLASRPYMTSLSLWFSERSRFPVTRVRKFLKQQNVFSRTLWMCCVSPWFSPSSQMLRWEWKKKKGFAWQHLVKKKTISDECKTKKKLRGLNARANFTDRTTATCHEVSANFADRGCPVASATDPYGRHLLSCTHEVGWTPFKTHNFSEIM